MAHPAKKYNLELKDAITRYDAWLKTQVLPYWAEKGFARNGAAIERLFENGQPDYKANKRIRVQARQMFAMAYAHHCRWINNGPGLVQRLDGFLLAKTNSKIPGFYPHALDAADMVIFSHRDLYDCAFYLLAYGWRYHVFHDLTALHNAERLIAEIESQLKGIKSGWQEGTIHSVMRRQNPHMHLFEAFLTLYEFTNDSRWLAYAGEMFSLFETVFYDHENAVVREFFNSNWQIDPAKGHIVEPGHMMEWIWLLLQYHKYTNKPVINYCKALYKTAINIGLDDDACVLYDEVTAAGEIIKGTKRCWPMTEWVKAALALASVGENSFDYEHHATWALNSLLSKYRNDAHHHLYIDQLDPNNQALDTSAPASTLYHLLMAHAEAVRYGR